MLMRRIAIIIPDVISDSHSWLQMLQQWQNLSLRNGEGGGWGMREGLGREGWRKQIFKDIQYHNTFFPVSFAPLDSVLRRSSGEREHTRILPGKTQGWGDGWVDHLQSPAVVFFSLLERARWKSDLWAGRPGLLASKAGVRGGLPRSAGMTALSQPG